MNNKQENATLRSSDSQPLPPRVVAFTKPCQKKMVWLAISIVIAAIILAAGGITCTLLIRGGRSSPNTFVDGNLAADSKEASVSDIIDKVSPSVVSIVTNTKSQSLFGGYRQVQAAGTGTIISKDDFVLTNKHERAVSSC